MAALKTKRITNEDLQFQVIHVKLFYEIFEATAPEDMTLTWDEWRARRDALVKCLIAEHWQEDTFTGGDKDDFDVGEDWFGRRNLGVTFISRRMYCMKPLRVIRSFISKLEKPYTVIVVGTCPAAFGNPILFEGLVTVGGSYIHCGPSSGLSWYEKMAKKDPEIKEWLDILLPLCKTRENH